MHAPSNDLRHNAEASRYALLQRLAPAIRHQLAGGFQPVTMMTAIIEKRLRAVSPDLQALLKTSGDVRALATAASRASLDLMGWIAPDPQAGVPFDEAITHAVHLLATDLSFRGFRILSQAEGLTTEVALIHVRGVVVAALLALTDAAAKPGQLRVTASREGQHMLVAATLTQATDTEDALTRHEELSTSRATYRTIDWDDVQAIAAADGVALNYTATNATLRLPLSPA